MLVLLCRAGGAEGAEGCRRGCEGRSSRRGRSRLCRGRRGPSRLGRSFREPRGDDGARGGRGSFPRDAAQRRARRGARGRGRSPSRGLVGGGGSGSGGGDGDGGGDGGAGGAGEGNESNASDERTRARRRRRQRRLCFPSFLYLGFCLSAKGKRELAAARVSCEEAAAATAAATRGGPTRPRRAPVRPRSSLAGSSATSPLPSGRRCRASAQQQQVFLQQQQLQQQLASPAATARPRPRPTPPPAAIAAAIATAATSPLSWRRSATAPSRELPSSSSRPRLPPRKLARPAPRRRQRAASWPGLAAAAAARSSAAANNASSSSAFEDLEGGGNGSGSGLQQLSFDPPDSYGRRSTKAAVAAADRAAVAVGRAVGKSPRGRVAALAYLTAVHLVLTFSALARSHRGAVSATAGAAASAATELLPGHVHDLAAACAELARSRGGGGLGGGA